MVNLCDTIKKPDKYLVGFFVCVCATGRTSRWYDVQTQEKEGLIVDFVQVYQ